MHISFVIPAYNEEKYIAKCLASVEKEIARTPCDCEVVVVNNASTDATAKIAGDFEMVRIVNEPKKGLVHARHAGMQASTGELILNIDSDTVLPGGWLETVLREFERDEKLVALSGPFIYYDLSILRRAYVKVFYFFGYITQLFLKMFRKGAMLQGGNFIIRRSSFEIVGGFDTTIEFYGEDTDVARRLNKVGKVKWTFALPMYTSGRRLSSEGVLTTGARYAINFIYTNLFGKPLTKSHKDIRETVKDSESF